jgi:hypothetical protein
LSGFDFEGTKALAQNLKTPIIASGGISSFEDLDCLTIEAKTALCNWSNLDCDESKQLLEAMGIAVVQAPSEGEMQASELVKTGEAYAVASQDYDALVVGGTRLVQNLTLTRSKANNNQCDGPSNSLNKKPNYIPTARFCLGRQGDYEKSKNKNKNEKRGPTLPGSRNPAPAIDLAFKPIPLWVVFYVTNVLLYVVHGLSINRSYERTKCCAHTKKPTVSHFHHWL